MHTWRGIDGTTEVTATNEQLADLRDWLAAWVPVEGDLDTRISNLFWRDMYEGYTLHNLNCVAVIEAVRNLEAGEEPYGVKAATQFKFPPLKGLWHKHYYSAQSIPHIVDRELDNGGWDRLVNELREPGTTESRINELASMAVFEPLARLSSKGKLTGEWVIFAKSDGANHYLSLGRHTIDDQIQYDRIMEYCVNDFPDLQQWVA